LPAANELAAWKRNIAPVEGSGKVLFVIESPAGRVPTETCSDPVAFTSVGWTVMVKSLFGNTVVGDGIGQMARTVGLVAG
jgi:hypothetical protein